jgi:hypothetical protein
LPNRVCPAKIWSGREQVSLRFQESRLDTKDQ